MQRYTGLDSGLECTRFLGIDESNHGHDPEIFVGVYSDNPFDILSNRFLRRPRLPKKRRIGRFLEDALKQECDFHYLYLPDEFKANFGEELMKVIAIAELIKAGNGIEKVIFDGKIRLEYRSALRLALPGKELPSCGVYTHADQKYPIVNMADNVANIILRLKQNGGVPEEYLPHKLFPDLAYYKSILKR